MLHHSYAALGHDVDAESSSRHQRNKDRHIAFSCVHAHLFALLGQIGNDGVSSRLWRIVVVADHIILVAGRVVVNIPSIVVVVGASMVPLGVVPLHLGSVRIVLVPMSSAVGQCGIAISSGSGTRSRRRAGGVPSFATTRESWTAIIIVPVGSAVLRVGHVGGQIGRRRCRRLARAVGRLRCCVLLATAARSR